MSAFAPKYPFSTWSWIFPSSKFTASPERDRTARRAETNELNRQADYLMYEIDRLRNDRLLTGLDKKVNASGLQEQLHSVREQLERLQAH
jgi:hypothetical protein